MDNIANIILIALMGLIGGGSSLCIIGYMLVVLAQKIVRKIRFGTPLYN